METGQLYYEDCHQKSFTAQVLSCEETEKGYAVVLDQQGCFRKAANLNYEVGQRVEEVLLMRHEETAVRRGRKWLPTLAAAAACLCLVTAGGLHMLTEPVGTVRMQINPDVMLWVNRLDRITRAEGLNEDGQDLMEGLSLRGKTMEELTGELVTRAVDMGYLEEGGYVALYFQSEDADWAAEAKQSLLAELEESLPEQVELLTLKEEPEQSFLNVFWT